MTQAAPAPVMPAPMAAPAPLMTVAPQPMVDVPTQIGYQQAMLDKGYYLEQAKYTSLLSVQKAIEDAKKLDLSEAMSRKLNSTFDPLETSFTGSMLYSLFGTGSGLRNLEPGEAQVLRRRDAAERFAAGATSIATEVVGAGIAGMVGAGLGAASPIPGGAIIGGIAGAMGFDSLLNADSIRKHFQRSGFIEGFSERFMRPGFSVDSDGAGFSRGETSEVVRFLEEMTRNDRFFDADEIDDMTKMFAGEGLFDTNRTVDDFKRTFANAKENLQSIMKQMNVSIEDGVALLGSFNQAGVQAHDVPHMVRGLEMAGRQAGMTGQEAVQMGIIGGRSMFQGTGVSMAHGVDMMTYNLSQLGGLESAGTLGQQTLQQVGGIHGAAATLAGYQKQALGSQGVTQALMAAYTGGDTLDMNILEGILRGDVSMGERTALAEKVFSDPQANIEFQARLPDLYNNMDPGVMAMLTRLPLMNHIDTLQRAGHDATPEALQSFVMKHYGKSAPEAEVLVSSMMDTDTDRLRRVQRAERAAERDRIYDQRSIWDDQSVLRYAAPSRWGRFIGGVWDENVEEPLVEWGSGIANEFEHWLEEKTGTYRFEALDPLSDDMRERLDRENRVHHTARMSVQDLLRPPAIPPEAAAAPPEAEAQPLQETDLYEEVQGHFETFDPATLTEGGEALSQQLAESVRSSGALDGGGDLGEEMIKKLGEQATALLSEALGSMSLNDSDRRRLEESVAALDDDVLKLIGRHVESASRQVGEAGVGQSDWLDQSIGAAWRTIGSHTTLPPEEAPPPTEMPPTPALPLLPEEEALTPTAMTPLISRSGQTYVLPSRPIPQLEDQPVAMPEADLYDWPADDQQAAMPEAEPFDRMLGADDKRAAMLDSLRASLREHEGQVVRDGKHVLYQDTKGYLTIGYGHNTGVRVEEGETLEDAVGRQSLSFHDEYGSGWTDEEAEEQLERDVAASERHAQQYDYYEDLSPEGQAVINEMIFNMGAGKKGDSAAGGFGSFIGFHAAMEQGVDSLRAGDEDRAQQWFEYAQQEMLYRDPSAPVDQRQPTQWALDVRNDRSGRVTALSDTVAAEATNWRPPLPGADPTVFLPRTPPRGEGEDPVIEFLRPSAAYEDEGDVMEPRTVWSQEAVPAQDVARYANDELVANMALLQNTQQMIQEQRTDPELTEDYSTRSEPFREAVAAVLEGVDTDDDDAVRGRALPVLQAIQETARDEGLSMEAAAPRAAAALQEMGIRTPVEQLRVDRVFPELGPAIDDVAEELGALSLDPATLPEGVTLDTSLLEAADRGRDLATTQWHELDEWGGDEGQLSGGDVHDILRTAHEMLPEAGRGNLLSTSIALLKASEGHTLQGEDWRTLYGAMGFSEEAIAEHEDFGALVGGLARSTTMAPAFFSQEGQVIPLEENIDLVDRGLSPLRSTDYELLKANYDTYGLGMSGEDVWQGPEALLPQREGGWAILEKESGTIADWEAGLEEEIAALTEQRDEATGDEAADIDRRLARRTAERDRIEALNLSDAERETDATVVTAVPRRRLQEEVLSNNQDLEQILLWMGRGGLPDEETQRQETMEEAKRLFNRVSDDEAPVQKERFEAYAQALEGGDEETIAEAADALRSSLESMGARPPAIDTFLEATRQGADDTLALTEAEGASERREIEDRIAEDHFEDAARTAVERDRGEDHFTFEERLHIGAYARGAFEDVSNPWTQSFGDRTSAQSVIGGFMESMAHEPSVRDRLEASIKEDLEVSSAAALDLDRLPEEAQEATRAVFERLFDEGIEDFSWEDYAQILPHLPEGGEARDLVFAGIRNQIEYLPEDVREQVRTSLGKSSPLTMEGALNQMQDVSAALEDEGIRILSAAGLGEADTNTITRTAKPIIEALLIQGGALDERSARGLGRGGRPLGKARGAEGWGIDKVASVLNDVSGEAEGDFRRLSGRLSVYLARASRAKARLRRQRTLEGQAADDLSPGEADELSRLQDDSDALEQTASENIERAISLLGGGEAVTRSVTELTEDETRFESLLPIEDEYIQKQNIFKDLYGGSQDVARRTLFEVLEEDEEGEKKITQSELGEITELYRHTGDPDIEPEVKAIQFLEEEGLLGALSSSVLEDVQDEGNLAVRKLIRGLGDDFDEEATAPADPEAADRFLSGLSDDTAGTDIKVDNSALATQQLATLQLVNENQNRMLSLMLMMEERLTGKRQGTL